jgi:aspartate-semialdehyde dehydrogenase
MDLPQLGMVATCVRVPVFCGHAVSFVAEFDGAMDADAAREALRGAPGVLLMDDPSGARYPTSIDAVGQDATLVGRIRNDPSRKNSIAGWCMADNLRKGAAVNAVQIAERWLQHRRAGEL